MVVETLVVRLVRRLLAAVAARASGIRTLLVVTPLISLGAVLSAYGLAMTYFSLHRLLGLIAFSPFLVAGGLMICAGLAATAALRRADRTVGDFFDQGARDRG